MYYRAFLKRRLCFAAVAAVLKPKGANCAVLPKAGIQSHSLIFLYQPKRGLHNADPVVVFLIWFCGCPEKAALREAGPSGPDEGKLPGKCRLRETPRAGARRIRAGTVVRLLRAAAGKYHVDGLEQNLDIIPEGPVVNVGHIQLDNLLKILDIAAAADLP